MIDEKELASVPGIRNRLSAYVTSLEQLRVSLGKQMEVYTSLRNRASIVAGMLRAQIAVDRSASALLELDMTLQEFYRET
jgi:hypothetical protein